jgi:RsiW-degrading membrane proteinase PrsW (M82 family)
MLNILIIILVAIAPCAFWLWIIYKGDKYKPEPKSLIVRTFFFGVGIAIPVALIETILYPGSIQGNLSVSTAAYVAFVVAGVTEEAGKFLVVRAGVYNSPHFEEPTDGLVYSAAAALGFASLENIIYVVSFGWQVILVRGLFSNLAHVLFSSLWGYPLALTKLGMMKPKSATWLGLATAMIAHGAFDFLFFTGTAYTYLVIPLFIGMVVLFIFMMKHANKISPYIEHRAKT